MEKVRENIGGSGDGTAKLSAADSKVKIMCSYGGKIQPRPRDQQLTYVGGDTKLLTLDRNIKFADVVAKLNSLCNFNSDELYMKYQLPGEDLDVLISLIDDDDFENMMFEYDRFQNKVSPSSKPLRFRIFLYGGNNSVKPNSDSGSDTPLNPDYLFGFDKEYDYSNSNKLNSGSTTSAFDLSLWTIPSSVVSGHSGSVKENGNQGPMNGFETQEARSGGGECVAAAPPPQFLYRIPVMNSGFHFAQYGPVPIGVVNGFGVGERRPIYNVIPSMTSVLPEKMKMIGGSTIDTASP